MIQRKQTLFLLLIAVISVTCLFANPAIGIAEATNHTLEVNYTKTFITEGDAVISSASNPYLSVSMWVILGLSIMSIFLFKNRKLQAMLVGFNFIFIGVAWFFIYYYIDTTINLEDVGQLSPEVQSGAVYTIIFPILNYLALRGIIADERLVKSMDRLR